jgi:hypothetical protein
LKVVLVMSGLRFHGARACAAALVAAAVCAGAAQSPGGLLSRSDADSFQRKIDLINQHSLTPAMTPRRTPVREPEVNAYLRFNLREEIPAGVVDPYISIIGDGRVGGRAVVDLDEVRRQRSSGGWFDPMSYLTGRVPVTARGILHTKAGVARLQIEAVELAGVSMPVGVLQELVSFYSRSPDHPNGFSLDDPFELPAAIREILVGKGEAIVVQ